MKNVLYACSYVPVEIVTACGLTPVWLLPEGEPQNADQYIHSLLCPYVRKLCAAVMSDIADMPVGVILTNSCDGMRRLADVIRVYRPDLPLLFLDVPHKTDPESVDLFAVRLRQFADKLASTFQGRPADDDALWRSIGRHNSVRLDMQELFMQLRTATPIVSGSEVFQFSKEAITSDIDDFLPSLHRFLAHISGRKRSMASRPASRIMIYGNILTTPDLVRIIENSGAVVVSLDHCFGERCFDLPVSTDTDSPYTALARRYLTRSPCPRMGGLLDQRIVDIASLAEEARADGVIYSSVMHCDHFLYDAPSTIGSLKGRDVPVLLLRHDGEWNALGQVKTRIEAFLETIENRKVHRYA
ncbi:MAG: 2-hydroxyacyl-CoA dehydratase [Deltaproteobacteria bacterium]|nr:2-hydroxyacyl-CoA dehydratase [Candidatus Zymogenaceae bacterium]